MLSHPLGQYRRDALAAGIIAKEEGSAPSNFCWPNRCTRNSGVTAKATRTGLRVLFNLVLRCLLWSSSNWSNKGAYDKGTLLLLSVGPLLLHLTFAAAGTPLSASVIKGRGSLAFGFGDHHPGGRPPRFGPARLTASPAF